jgi:phage terminase large subunit-like protein
MISTEELVAFRPSYAAWPVAEDILERGEPEVVLAYLRERKRMIEEAEADPLNSCYVPRIWKTVDRNIAELREKFPKGVIKLAIFGGNRSSKTFYAANHVNKDLVANPGHRWWACDSTEAQARSNQMRLIWQQFPLGWKNLERDSVTDIRYNVSDGFPKNMFVAPNGSECHFKFYSMDVENLPGSEVNGIWCDELVPLDWVESIIYRLANRNGILIITFTPEFGWNETFGHFYEGAVTLEDEEALLLPRKNAKGRTTGFERVPRVLQCADETERIIFFHTNDNPFGNYEAIRQEEKARGNNRDSILIRVYGVCSKSHRIAFPMFNRRAHVISTDAFRAITEKHEQAVRYHLVDPCDGRNWFMCWILCPRPDWWILYREWPSHGHSAAYIRGVGLLGPWAVSGSAADGVRGPAQDSKGFSLERYTEEIEEKETDEEGVRETVLARYIDSRYSTQRRTERETVTTLQEQLGEIGMDFLCMTAESRILGAHDGSIDMINSALFYDLETPLGKFSAALGRLNRPQLQVVETCPNTIWALEHWSGLDGQRGSCKDPIDCIRGAFLSGINYVDDTVDSFVGGGIPRIG